MSRVRLCAIQFPASVPLPAEYSASSAANYSTHIAGEMKTFAQFNWTIHWIHWCSHFGMLIELHRSSLNIFTIFCRYIYPLPFGHNHIHKLSWTRVQINTKILKLARIGGTSFQNERRRVLSMCPASDLDDTIQDNKFAAAFFATKNGSSNRLLLILFIFSFLHGNGVVQTASTFTQAG